jgi:hypothetical protein
VLLACTQVSNAIIFGAGQVLARDSGDVAMFLVGPIMSFFARHKQPAVSDVEFCADLFVGTHVPADRDITLLNTNGTQNWSGRHVSGNQRG